MGEPQTRAASAGQRLREPRLGVGAEERAPGGRLPILGPPQAGAGPGPPVPSLHFALRRPRPGPGPWCPVTKESAHHFLGVWAGV